MDDFKVMARILAAVKECEHAREMNPTMFDTKLLKADEATRDSLIVKLQRDGYVEGFCIIDDIDGHPYPVVLIEKSVPNITIKGLTFIEENKPLKKMIETLKKEIWDVAKRGLAHGIMLL